MAEMRAQGDERGQALFNQILAEHADGDVNRVFKLINTNRDVPPADAIPSLKEYFQEGDNLPPDTDFARIQRGEEVFLSHGLIGVLVLLTKSLPTGYGAPALSKVLMMSGELKKRPYHRLLGVAQLVIDVCSGHGFQEEGRAISTARKVRLLHAGVRHIAGDYLSQQTPSYLKTHGVPVNQEDMLATLMGFSLLMIQGWRQLAVGVTPPQEEDYLYLWNQYGLLMGIKPEYLPVSVADAEAFFEAYERRQMVPVEQNPDGAVLGKANLEMMERMLPTWARRLGAGLVPRIYMNQLLGREGCERIGIPVVRGHALLKGLLRHVPVDPLRAVPLVGSVDLLLHEFISRTVIQGLIDLDYGGRPSFWVPETLEDLWKLTESNQRQKGGAPGRA